jgi:predicted nucleic acid-binding protein
LGGRHLVDLRSALREVLEIARTLQLTAYDAAYVALAARRHMPLAMIDDGLKEPCRRADVEQVT